MNIYALKGHKVRCENLSGGYWNHQDVAKLHLIIGNIYTVDRTKVGNSHTDVYLEEIPNVNFNSVFFEDVIEQSIEDTKTHPDYIRYNKRHVAGVNSEKPDNNCGKPSRIIVVEIYSDENIPEECRYTAAVTDSSNEYTPIVVTGKDITECFKEISITMDFVDEYRKK
jgi:hypothetical protein